MLSSLNTHAFDFYAVVPVVAGPLQVLLAILPGLLIALVTLVFSLFRPKVMWGMCRLAWRLKYQLVAILLMVGVGGFLVRTLFSQLPDGGTGSSDDGDWATARGNMARTGAAPEAVAPTRGGVNWTWNRPGQAIYSSPAIAGNRVYFTTAVYSPLGDGRGEIIAVDATTGETVWRMAPPGYRATVSSPVLQGKYLVVGEGMHTVKDARVFCIDRTAGKEGGVIWSLRTKSHVESTPLIHEGRVYIGAGDDGLYCASLTETVDSKPKVFWHLPGDKFPDIETTPAIVHREGVDYLIFGLGVDGNAICCVNAETGEEMRRVKTPYPVFGIPAVWEDQVYICMGNGDLIRTAEEISLPPGGAVWALNIDRMINPDPETAQPVAWKFKTPRTNLGGVIAGEKDLIFGSRDEHLYKLNHQGELLKRWHSHARIIASPAATDDTIVVATNAGLLHAVSRRTLKPLWEAGIGPKGNYLSSPTIAAGQVFVGTESNGIHSVGRTDASDKAASIWAGRLGGPGHGGNVARETLPAKGAFEWQYPEATPGEKPAPSLTAPVALAGDYLFAPVAGKRTGLARLPAVRGEEDTPEIEWGEHELGILATRRAIVQSPAISGKAVLFVDGKLGEGGKKLHSVDIETGEALWETNVGTYATGSFLVTQDEVFIQDAPDQLSCRLLQQEGRKRWTADCGRLDHSVAIGATLVAAASAEPNQLTIFDRIRGDKLAQATLPSEPISPPIVAGKFVFVATAKDVIAFQLTEVDLKPAWSVEIAFANELVLADELLYGVTQAGELLVISAVDGKIKQRVPGISPDLPPLVAGKMVLAAAKDRLVVVDLSAKILPDEKPTVATWMDTSWLGPPTTPLVLHRGHLYGGRKDWGVVRWGPAK